MINKFGSLLFTLLGASFISSGANKFGSLLFTLLGASFISSGACLHSFPLALVELSCTYCVFDILSIFSQNNLECTEVMKKQACNLAIKAKVN